MSIDNSKQAAPVSALADVVKYTRLARGIQNPAGAYPNGPWEDFYACDDVVRALAASQPSHAPVAMTPKDTPESMAESNARFAIDGAIQYGREGRNKPPSEDHWLMEYWLIGQQLRELGKTGLDNRTPLDPGEKAAIAAQQEAV